MSILAILLGIGSAAGFAIGSVLEQHAAKRERPTRTMDPRLLLRLLTRPMWLLGWVPDAIGTGLQAFALRYGPLALVEPLLVSGLFMAIPLEAALERRRPHRRDILVVVLGVVGLTAFLAAAYPQAGVPVPTPLAWLGVGIAAGVLVLICLAVAWRTSGAARGIMLGIATGLLYGVAAALLKAITTRLDGNLLAVFADWHLYALMVVGLAAIALNQNAFQGGPIAAPLTTIALVDPLSSVFIGITAFQERLSVDGPRLAIQLVAVAMMVSGIWLARRTRSE